MKNRTTTFKTKDITYRTLYDDYWMNGAWQVYWLGISFQVSPPRRWMHSSTTRIAVWLLIPCAALIAEELLIVLSNKVDRNAVFSWLFMMTRSTTLIFKHGFIGYLSVSIQQHFDAFEMILFRVIKSHWKTKIHGIASVQTWSVDRPWLLDKMI